MYYNRYYESHTILTNVLNKTIILLTFTIINNSLIILQNSYIYINN